MGIYHKKIYKLILLILVNKQDKYHFVCINSIDSFKSSTLGKKSN